MRFVGHRLIPSAWILLASGCAQPEVYTEPYTTVEPVALTAPLAVTLSVSYAMDGKPNPQRAGEIQAALAAGLDKGGAFKMAEPGSTGGLLAITVHDGPSATKGSFLAGFTASVGHALVSQPEFTPQGRRTARDLEVEISYTPAGGQAQDHSYVNRLVTITNNTQEPTDLVPMHDRKYAELAFIGNDLNAFAQALAKGQAPAAP